MYVIFPEALPFPFLIFFISDSFASVLESKIQTLHAAAATAIGSVNARGDTVIARLQDIPNRVREVAGHGVRRGRATAQLESGHDFSQVELTHFPPGSEDWLAFEDLADDMKMAATAISEDVSIEAIIGNVFADD